MWWNLHDALKARAASVTPEQAAWRQQAHSVIRAYFEGDVDLSALKGVASGFRGFALTLVTDPDSEEWSLLMTALDVLLDDAGDANRVKRISHGLVTLEDYVETLQPSQPRQKHAW